MQIHGSKKGQQQARKPVIAKDDLVSTSFYKGLYGLCEGEISGLADGAKSIRLDGTPLINDNGQANFEGVDWDIRTGTLDQSYITGFSAVENETNVGVELRHDRPFVRAINNKSLSAVRVRLNFNALREQKDNGDIVGYAVQYAIDVQTDGGAYTEVLNNTVRGKASQGFKKSHRIDLPKATRNWTIRVRRLSANRDSDLIADTVSIDAITEIVDAKLRYPATALLGLSYDAKTFSNIAKIAVRLKGKIIQVPTNYNPETRTYHGLWDGTFKPAYSNNPAWVLYDLCTHKRYGLGERLSNMVDKWRLYTLAQYCDEMVDDGQGGREPRFAMNAYIQKDEDAYSVLQSIASVFRGLIFWDGSHIIVDSDTPKDAVYTFSRANVVDGEFSYTGTRARDRHTVAKVAWDNPNNEFKTEYELVRDEEAIAKYGIRTLDINAFGCTSKGQAQRAGLWALKSEQLETRTVSFKTGLEGFIPQVGQVIHIADEVFAGRAISGRVLSVNAKTKQITLDRMAGKVGDTLTLNTANSQATARITAIKGTTLTLDKELLADTDSVWAIVSDELKLMAFRILSISQNDDATFDITALQYERQKYNAIDKGAIITPTPITAIHATPILAPKSVSITSNTRTHQGQAITTLSINWGQVQGATAYIVAWRKDDGNWQTLPKISGQSVDIEGVYSGRYIARVQAVDAFDNESLATSSTLTAITGKQGKPPRLASLSVKGVLFGMNIDWAFNKGSDDTNFTEIEVSPDGKSNITTLGTFAYPTNKHEITGLQGNLTQYYRGRIVDKLGNTSDWTSWAKGVTDASATKVLDLLDGQITQSQLHNDLATPIGKIDSLQSAIATANGNIGTLNTRISTAQSAINKAQQDLATATKNITTERSRISTAIRDITTLQTANNAKTQEIANLTNTVGNHTSSIRDLGVTTGDLSQRYNQLKTQSDKATSDITAIKQTQSGQATSIEKMGVKIDGLPTSDNLLDGKQSTATANYLLASYTLNTKITDKQKVVLTVWGDISDDRTLLVFNSSGAGSARVGELTKIGEGVYQLVADWTAYASNDNLLIYQSPRGATSVNTITRATLTLADPLGVSTEASLDEFKQTQASKDSVTANKISQIETAYKQADNATNAKLTSLEQTVSDKDTAMAKRVDGLQADYNSNKASIANQLKSLSDKDTATASQISQITANVTTAQSTANTANTNAQNAKRVADDALGKANTANSAITTEQKARADADSALSSRISQLDSAYKQADTALSGRITTAQNTASNAQQAVATAQTQLNARVDDVLSAVTIADTRNDNQPPNWYWTNHPMRVVNEFKSASVLGLSDFGTYVNLETRVYWRDSSGGSIVQTAYNQLDPTRQMQRQSSGRGDTATWTVWQSPFAVVQAHAEASLDEFKQTQASKDSATTKSMQTLQTTVGQHTASIQTHAQSLNGLNAQYTIKVDTGGRVAGIGLASQSGVSEMAVRADKFYIAPPSGGKGKAPFSVLTAPKVVNGVTVPAGTYIDSAYIANGSIDVAKINKASIQSLSALSATLGHFKSAETGARLEIKDGVLLVYDNNNVLRARLGVW